MTFREDGSATVEWVASYLERLRDFPVLAQVAPGELRERLPESPPEHAEPFSAVLRDLDELLLPAVTHWQSPRFFAYFANTGSEPGIPATTGGTFDASARVQAQVTSGVGDAPHDEQRRPQNLPASCTLGRGHD